MNLSIRKVFANGRWATAADSLHHPRMALAIKQRRKERGWTQEVLAEKIGISVPYLSQLERGADNKQVGERLLFKFAAAFDCTVPELFDDHPLTAEERAIIDDLKALPPDLAAALAAVVHALAVRSGPMPPEDR